MKNALRGILSKCFLLSSHAKSPVFDFFKNSDASKVISTPARRRSIHAEIYGCCAKQLMRQDIEHRQS